jgi:FkbM family methyltransferase
MFEILQGETVLDVGAHIGTSVRLWKSLGAGTVIAVEPEPGNAAMLRRNTEDLEGVRVIEAACVARAEGPVTLYVNSSKGKDWHSVIPTAGRDEVTVPVVAFNDLLEEYRPGKVKLDAEGIEYSLLAGSPIVPSYVHGLLVEAHLLRKGQRAEFWPLVHRLEAEGFTVRFLNRYTEGVWAVVFIAERES